MNAVLECEITLPKKFETVCESGEPISIHVTNVSGNKGRAIMRIVCKDGVTQDALAKIGETSIPIKVLSSTDDVKSFESAGRVSNLIGGHLPTSVEAAAARYTTPDVPQGEPYRAPAAKPMEPAQIPAQATAAGANQDQMRLIFAAMKAAGMPIPDALIAGVAMPQTQAPTAPTTPRPQPPKENCIRSYDELISELNNLPGIDDKMNIPTDRKMTPMEAEMILSRMPKLRKRAYVRNVMESQLMVSDLYTSIDGGAGPCMTLLPGAAYDMARLPARNILNSTDLKWCFDTGKLEMVDGAQFAASFKKVNDEASSWGKSELPVYGGSSARTNPHEAGESMAEALAAGAAMDGDSPITVGGASGELAVSSSTDDRPPSYSYEDNHAMQNVINQMPRERAPQAEPPRRVR